MYIPQTDLSVGVLTVLYQGALPGASPRWRLRVSIFHCEYRWIRDGPSKTHSKVNTKVNFLVFGSRMVKIYDRNAFWMAWALGCVLVSPSSKMGPGCRLTGNDRNSNILTLRGLEKTLQDFARFCWNLTRNGYLKMRKNVKICKVCQKKWRLQNIVTKTYQNKEKTCLESVIFVIPLVRNRRFHFSQF